MYCFSSEMRLSFLRDALRFFFSVKSVRSSLRRKLQFLKAETGVSCGGNERFRLRERTTRPYKILRTNIHLDIQVPEGILKTLSVKGGELLKVWSLHHECQ